jgi:hypothetical protein
MNTIFFFLLIHVFFFFFFLYVYYKFFFGVGGCPSPGACWAYPRAGPVHAISFIGVFLEENL